MTAQRESNTPWPPAEIETISKLWDEGKSASEIAKALPHRSRAAVCGKARRLGLKDRGSPEIFQSSTAVINRLRQTRAPEVKRDRQPGAVNARKGRPPKPGPQNKPGAVFGNMPVTNAAEAQAKREAAAKVGTTIMDRFMTPANDDAILLVRRGIYQCAWPVGEPERPADQLCCGRRVDLGATKTTASYCPTHRARASSGIPMTKRDQERLARRAA